MGRDETEASRIFWQLPEKTAREGNQKSFVTVAAMYSVGFNVQELRHALHHLHNPNSVSKVLRFVGCISDL